MVKSMAHSVSDSDSDSNSNNYSLFNFWSCLGKLDFPMLLKRYVETHDSNSL